MGRYAYGKFMMQFSYGLQRAIAAGTPVVKKPKRNK